MKKLPALLSLFLAVAVWMSFTYIDNEGGLKVGDIAPQIKLMGVDGDYFSFESSEDINGWIVTFTCNTCPFSVLYEDRLIELHNKYAAKGWPVVAINPNDPAAKAGDSLDDMKVRAKEKGFPFEYLFDEGQHVYPQYGATRTPHIFLLDKTRKVRYIGAIDDNARDPENVNVNYVAEAIKAIENGKDPDPNFTKAIGCSIKTLK
jgi:peroxiredoxin